MPSRTTRDRIVATVAGAVYGAGLSVGLDRLREPIVVPAGSRLRPTDFLDAVVYGPLLDLGGAGRSAAAAAAYFGAMTFLVVSAARDRTWRPLAAVAVVGSVLAVVAACSAEMPSAFSAGGFRLPRLRDASLRTFAHSSPEGFVLLVLAVVAWYAVAVGCLVAGPSRRDRVPSSAVPEPPTRRPPAGRSDAAGRTAVGLVKEYGAPLLAGAAFGISLGGALLTVSEQSWGGRGADGRAIVVMAGGPPAVGMILNRPGSEPRLLLAATYGTLAVLLHQACRGRRRKQVAAAAYGLAVAAHAAFAVAMLSDIEGGPAVSLDRAAFGAALTYATGRVAFVVLGLAGWHAFAVWSLVRLPPGHVRPDLADA